MKQARNTKEIFQGSLMVLLTVSFICFAACRPSGDADSQPQRPVSQESIARERAVEVAKTAVSKESDLRFLDFSTADNETSWIVTFDLKPEFQTRTGGPSVVVIDKKTGEVTSVYVSK